MSKVLISILSDNLIANFLFYKEKHQEFDEQIFITTPEMKAKGVGNNLETAMGLELNSIRRIEVPNDCYSDVIEKLETENLPNDNEYWVNQTGGTKPMSIAVFQFFQSRNARFVYLPIGGKAFLDLTDKSILYGITYTASLNEYLALYGVRYESNSKIVHGEQQLNEIFNDVKKSNWNLPPNLRKADTCYENPEDRVFYKGAWFEEYSYMRIKRDFGLRDDQISLSAKLYRKDSLVNDNEIDVIFVKDNTLHIVECKVSMYGNVTHGGVDPKDTVTDYLYKLAAIAKDLGLRVNAYLFTLHRMSKFSEGNLKGFDNRVKILGLKGIFDGNLLAKMPLCLENRKNPSIAESPTRKEKETTTETNISKETREQLVNIKVVGKIDLSTVYKK